MLLLHNDTDNTVLSIGANHLCMGLSRFVLLRVTTSSSNQRMSLTKDCHLQTCHPVSSI